MRRDVTGDLRLVGAKYVVLEQRTPRSSRGRRQVPDIQNAVNQSIEARIGTHRDAGHSVPPVIDQHIEGLERLDVMPPQRRNENSIARRQLRSQSSGERYME